MSGVLRGVFPVLPTIFDAAGGVDTRSTLDVLEFTLDAGVDGVVFPGLASEYDHLTLDERLSLINAIGSVARGRTTFIVGAGSTSTDETVSLARAGIAAGASAAMVMTPHRLDGDLRGLADFYTALAKAAPLDILLQNAPRPMGLGLDVEALVDILRTVPAVTHLKEETVPCGPRISRLLTSVPGVAGVFGGAGGRHIIDELTRGAVGTMPASELADTHVALVAAFHAGDTPAARGYYERMMPILMMQSIYRWRLTKAVLAMRGVIRSEFTRAPGPALDQHDREELKAWLARLGHVVREPQATAAVG